MGRPPSTLVEIITANCRPQPAIPALLVLLLSALFQMMAGAPAPDAVASGAAAAAGPSALAAWGITLGLLASCGLAVAAGFCSFFPMVAWIALGLFLFGTRMAVLPWHTRAALYLGIAVAALMILVQLWRVRTKRFVPTIEDRPEE